MPGARPQCAQDLRNVVLAEHIRHPHRAARASRVAHLFDDPRWQFARRGNDVDHPGRDGAAGHAVEARFRRILDRDQAALVPDRAHAERAVGAHPGEDDANAASLVLRRQFAQEPIDR